MTSLTSKNVLGLADWRRRVNELYAQIRHSPNPAQAWDGFCATRNWLFAHHPQTPLSDLQRAHFSQLAYFEYQPQWRVMGRVETAVSRHTHQIDLPAEGDFRYTHIANVQFTIQKQKATLSLFWVEGYGGGLFLPFQDVTNGTTTYGGGRYLYDSIKGADLGKYTDLGNDTDLGSGSEQILLDFNFAYNPSCAYNDQWVCPLSPPENRLPFAINSGEMAFTL